MQNFNLFDAGEIVLDVLCDRFVTKRSMIPANLLQATLEVLTES